MPCVMLWWAMTELPKQTRTERNFLTAPWRRRESGVSHERWMTSQRDAAAGDPKYFGRPTGPARPPTPSLSTGRRSAPRYFYTFLLRTLPGVILICLIDTSFTANVTGINNANIQHRSYSCPRLDRSWAISVQLNFYIILSFRPPFSKKSLSKRFFHWNFACNLQAFLPVSFQIHMSKPSESRTFSKLSLSLCVSYGASDLIRVMASLISWGFETS